MNILKIYRCKQCNCELVEDYLLKLGYKWNNKKPNEKITISYFTRNSKYVFFYIRIDNSITYSSSLDRNRKYIDIERIFKLKKLI